MDLHRCLQDRRLLAIVRGNDADAALRTVDVLLDSGITLLEVSLGTAGAFDVIRRVAASGGAAATIGAGTVLEADDADRAADAGATFLVTPAAGAGATRGFALRIPVLTGAFTPTEAVTAMREGAAAIKLFPAMLGGPDYLRALREPLPDVPFVPVGGVREDQVTAYLDAGAIAVGVGSPLVGDAASGGDLEALRERARLFVRALSASEAP
jgi:2-dehydro-3-deoxyphosphogluconate aldolase/(4S)-4-hydroxy-2-oxoglutarate aldolase